MSKILRRIGLFGPAVAALLMGPASAAIVLDRVDPYYTGAAYPLYGAHPEIFTIDPSISGILASIELAFPPNAFPQLVTVSYSNNGSVFFGASSEMVPDYLNVTFTPSAMVHITAGTPFYVKLALADPANPGAFYGGVPEPFTHVVSGPSANMGYREFVNTDVPAVPEPSSLALIVGALFGFGWLQRHRVRTTRGNATEL